MNLLKPNDAIINPIKGKRTPDIGALAIIVSSEADLRELRKTMNLNAECSRPLMMSRVFYPDNEAPNFSVTGPILGAPYAVMVLENIIPWGAKEILFIGWCGAISEDVSIGDIIVPTGAMIDEGTSPSYGADTRAPVPGFPKMSQKIRSALDHHAIRYHEGMVWSTDAVFRETEEKVRFYQSLNVLAVEMEVSALFTVGRFRGIEVGAVLIVSDELSAYRWVPGFKYEPFISARKRVIEAISDLILKDGDLNNLFRENT